MTTAELTDIAEAAACLTDALAEIDASCVPIGDLKRSRWIDSQMKLIAMIHEGSNRYGQRKKLFDDALAKARGELPEQGELFTAPTKDDVPGQRTFAETTGEADLPSLSQWAVQTVSQDILKSRVLAAVAGGAGRTKAIAETMEGLGRDKFEVEAAWDDMIRMGWLVKDGKKWSLSEEAKDFVAMTVANIASPAQVEQIIEQLSEPDMLGVTPKDLGAVSVSDFISDPINPTTEEAEQWLINHQARVQAATAEAASE